MGQFEKCTAGVASRAERSQGWSSQKGGAGLQACRQLAVMPRALAPGTSAAEAAAKGGLPCSAKALLHPKSKAAQARENSKLTHYPQEFDVELVEVHT
jgi:hypothetical protein